MPEETKSEFSKVKVVWAGLAELANGNLAAVLKTINADGSVNEEDRAVFDKKLFKKTVMFNGGVYEIEAKPGLESIRLSTTKYVGLWPNEADRIEWKAQEKAFEIAAAAAKLEKQDKQLNAMMEALKPIRKAYQKTNYAGRLALEVQVLAYLRTGVKAGY